MDEHRDIRHESGRHGQAVRPNNDAFTYINVATAAVLVLSLTTLLFQRNNLALAAPATESGPTAALPDSKGKDPGLAEIKKLTDRVKDFRVFELTRDAGDVRLNATWSLTIEHLRGVPIDDDPPIFRQQPPTYRPPHTDGIKPPRSRPYVAKGVLPFRFTHFNCEFNYGGRGNSEMRDYAATHGFNIVSYNAGPHMPAGTEFLKWGGGLDWENLFSNTKFETGRFDIYAQVAATHDVVETAIGRGRFRHRPGFTHRMVDIEHGCLSPDKLSQQSWYPKGKDQAARQAFEARYYEGYALTYLAPLRVARRQGWEKLSIYGWYMVPRTWWGLDRLTIEPGQDWQWRRYGNLLYQASDIINNSVYCPYWDPGNVAHTLANIDFTMQYVNAQPNRKPVRPYYWTLLHGGGGGWRWWKGLPIASEESRAMHAMGFFTGFDGFDAWNWSGNSNHHRPTIDPVHRDGDRPDTRMIGVKPADVMLGKAFTLTGSDNKQETFQRYDVLHLLEYDRPSHEISFQKIRHGKKNHGWHKDYPVFKLHQSELVDKLRPLSEPVAAMIEGLALVKPFEYVLRHGQVKIDVPAQLQWKKKLSVARRVKYKNYHVLITYDPGVIYGGRPRDIILNDFDGTKDRTLRLHADAQTRIFVLRDQE